MLDLCLFGFHFIQFMKQSNYRTHFNKEKIEEVNFFTSEQLGAKDAKPSFEVL